MPKINSNKKEEFGNFQIPGEKDPKQEEIENKMAELGLHFTDEEKEKEQKAEIKKADEDFINSFSPEDIDDINAEWIANNPFPPSNRDDGNPLDYRSF